MLPINMNYNAVKDAVVISIDKVISCNIPIQMESILFSSLMNGF